MNEFIFVYDVFLFIVIYLCSFYLVINGDDWFMIWLGLEINMMMFIIIVFERYNMMNIESCLKYFFVQALGTAVFMCMFYVSEEYMNFVLSLILSYKIGGGPFFFWFPSVCSGISWMSCFILMTIQKVMPLLLMGMFISWVFFFVLTMSLVIGVFGSFNQSNYKLLMSYSSIYHLGWILLCVFVDGMCWVNYLLMYSMMILPVIYFMKVNGVFDFLSVVKGKNKLWLIIMMLSMGGMPPFLGFFLKWFVFVSVMNVGIFFMIVLIICSVIMFYIYFRVVYDILLGYFCYSDWKSWFMNCKNKVWLDFVSFMGMLLGMMISFYMLV